MGEALDISLAAPIRVCLCHGGIPNALSINISVIIFAVFVLTVFVDRVFIKITTFILSGNKNHLTI
jgi:hypothetical protein